ncbi:MAG TPA: hypothetical protein VGQ83_35730 [Polyangia bacterium]|jgi:hypothetical protein
MSRLAHAAVLLVVVAAASSARASEEEIRPWKKIVLTVDGGSDFGDVEVTVVMTTGAKPALRSLAWNVKGKKVTVPPDGLKDPPPLVFESVRVHTERGYDRSPWLYVVFEVEKRSLPASATARWVYFASQDGKLKHRSIKTRDRNNQYQFEQKPLAGSR